MTALYVAGAALTARLGTRLGIARTLRLCSMGFMLGGAVDVSPRLAGTAAGLSSSLALALSGGISILSGTLYDGSFAPVALLMAAAATMTAATSKLAARH
ncbi:MAG: hypothetical protein L6Q83_03190 [Gammaproteobacteria bacterium]|nr:hypothetical protein [Gammaproteobacteria bacterium]